MTAGAVLRPTHHDNDRPGSLSSIGRCENAHQALSRAVEGEGLFSHGVPSTESTNLSVGASSAGHSTMSAAFQFQNSGPATTSLLTAIPARPRASTASREDDGTEPLASAETSSQPT